MYLVLLYTVYVQEAFIIQYHNKHVLKVYIVIYLYTALKYIDSAIVRWLSFGEIPFSMHSCLSLALLECNECIYNTITMGELVYCKIT